MTSVAIYGDSFGSTYENAWPQYLELILNKKNKTNFKFTTYAVSGSSCEYSYAKFLDTHENHDIVIFLWSGAFRSSLISKEQSGKYKCHSCFHFQNDIKRCYEISNFLNRNYSYGFDDLNSNIKDWIKHEHKFIQKYPTKNFLFNQAMRDSVKSRRPDSVNIECFDEFNDKCGVINIWWEDYRQFEYDVQTRGLTSEGLKYEENFHIRTNHLTKIQNIEFAKYLYMHMKKENFDIHDTFSEPKKYYTMSKNLETSGFIFK